MGGGREGVEIVGKKYQELIVGGRKRGGGFPFLTMKTTVLRTFVYI